MPNEKEMKPCRYCNCGYCKDSLIGKLVEALESIEQVTPKKGSVNQWAKEALALVKSSGEGAGGEGS